jgi:hypothetical protein
MNAAFPARLKSKVVLASFGCIALFLVVAMTAGVASALPAIHAVHGANQQTTYGSSFPAPLVVWISDPVTERSISGLRIDFTPGAGIGLSSSYAITDEQGLAAVTATGLAVCTSGVSAEVSGFPGAKVSFEGLAVGKGTLKVVPADLSSRLGSPVPPITSYTITGFMNGDTEESAQITGSPVLTTTAKEHSPHANYAIKGGVGSLSAPNYNFVPGFGTLAILVGPNPGNLQDQPLEASIVAPAKEESVEVRQAIESEGANTLSTYQPPSAPRGPAELDVRSAITPIPVKAPETARHSQPRSAIPAVVVADLRKAPGAPVRAAALPKLAPVPANAKNAGTRSAIAPMPASTLPKNPDAPVRTALSPTLVTAVTGQPSNVQPTIRKAFNPSTAK